MAAKDTDTFTGNKGLRIEEPLIFEQHAPGRSGVDLPEPLRFSIVWAVSNAAMSSVFPICGTTGHAALHASQPEELRDRCRVLSACSCTMKHNPRLNEKVARLPGLADVHPLQPASTVQGALRLIDTLAHWIKTLTGMPAVAMSPAAGAHGELCGLMTARAALEARGDARKRVLVPDSAHGTNPATAAICGYSVEAIPLNDRGRVICGVESGTRRCSRVHVDQP